MWFLHRKRVNENHLQGGEEGSSANEGGGSLGADLGARASLDDGGGRLAGHFALVVVVVVVGIVVVGIVVVGVVVVVVIVVVAVVVAVVAAHAAARVAPGGRGLRRMVVTALAVVRVVRLHGTGVLVVERLARGGLARGARSGGLTMGARGGRVVVVVVLLLGARSRGRVVVVVVSRHAAARVLALVRRGAGRARVVVVVLALGQRARSRVLVVSRQDRGVRARVVVSGARRRRVVRVLGSGGGQGGQGQDSSSARETHLDDCWWRKGYTGK